MTSNIGTDLIMDMEEKKDIDIKIKEVMKRHFRPEFLNRVDEVIVFNQLDKEYIRKIVDIQLGILSNRLKEKNFDVEITDKAKDLLGELGYDLAYGARPLKRVVQKYIQDPIALKILEGKIREKDSINVDVAKKEFIFSSKSSKAKDN